MLKCQNCKLDKIIKRGFRYNKLIKKQKYFCLNCKKWFVENDGFKRMRFDPRIIVRAIHMHLDGFSLFKTQYHLWQHDGIKVTRRTISKWAKKYSAFLKSGKSVRANLKRKTAL